MKTNLLKSMPLLLALLTPSCATSIGRIVVKDGKEPNGHIAISSTKNVEFWADVNVSYVRKAEILYSIKVFHNGDLIHSCSDDALFHNDRGGEYMFVWNSNDDGRQTVRYQKKLDCGFIPPEAGDYRFEIDQMFKGRLFEVNKCDLILRQ